MILAEDLLRMAFIMLQSLPPVGILFSVLTINECCILNAFSESNDKIDFYPLFLMSCITLTNLFMIILKNKCSQGFRSGRTWMFDSEGGD